MLGNYFVLRHLKNVIFNRLMLWYCMFNTEIERITCCGCKVLYNKLAMCGCWPQAYELRNCQIALSPIPKKLNTCSHYIVPYPLSTCCLRKIRWPSAITWLTVLFRCELISDLVICKHRKGYGHTWHWMLYWDQQATAQTHMLSSIPSVHVIIWLVLFSTLNY